MAQTIEGEYDGNIATFRLNELDTSKEIGGSNVLYFLKVERLSDKDIRMAIWSSSMLTTVEECSISKMAYKVTSKRTPMIRDLITLFGGDEVPPLIDQRLRIASRLIQERWLGSDYNDSALSAIPHSTDRKDIIFISKDDKEKAFEILKNPDLLNLIDREVAKKFSGDEKNRKLGILCLGASISKEYVDYILTGQSAIGKSRYMKALLRIYPDEYFVDAGRLSRRAPERMREELEKAFILYIREQRGSEQASDALRLMSSDDGGMTAFVVDDKNLGILTFKVKGMARFTTQVDYELQDEDDTRFLKTELDPSPKQTRKVLTYQGLEGAFPLRIREKKGKENPDMSMVFKNAFRLLKKGVGVLIPFDPLLNSYLSDRHVRIKRDNAKLASLIKASAILHMYQRNWVTIDEEDFVVANIDDLRIALTYGEPEIGKNYIQISNLKINLIKLINDMYAKNWATSPLGIPTIEILKTVKENLGYSKTWVYKQLRELRDQSFLVAEIHQDADNPNINTYYYKPVVGTERSIFAKLLNLDDDQTLLMFEQSVKEWQKIIKNEYSGIFHLGEINISIPSAEQGIAESAESAEPEPWYKLLPDDEEN